jgi:hypothetical protein
LCSFRAIDVSLLTTSLFRRETCQPEMALVVFEGRQPVLIIEVKPAQKRISARTKLLVPESTQEQLDSYRRLGVPVKYVPGMSAAVAFCKSFELPIVPKS